MWIVVALVALLSWQELRSRDVLGRFVSRLMQARLAERQSSERRIARLALVFLCLSAAVLALMQPQTKGRTETVSAGRVSADIVIVLDVSKSMLAEDAAPYRLARAKAEIGSLVERLDGHRIGLVAFAGRAAVLCPLTPDYGFFRMILRGASPTSVSRGGTKIGDAIRKGLTTFGKDSSGSKLMLLVTDGEDHDSYPLDAAKQAIEANVRIVTIAFGSEEGSPITIHDPDTGASTQLRDRDNNIVQSRVDGALLRKIALQTEGAFVPAGVAALDLESIVAEHINPIVRQASDSAVRTIPGEQYPWFVLASLIALLLSVWVGASTSPLSRGLRG